MTMRDESVLSSIDHVVCCPDRNGSIATAASFFGRWFGAGGTADRLVVKISIGVSREVVGTERLGVTTATHRSYFDKAIVSL